MSPAERPGKGAVTAQFEATVTLLGVKRSGCGLLPSTRTLNNDPPRRKTKRSPAESGVIPDGFGFNGGVIPPGLMDIAG